MGVNLVSGIHRNHPSYYTGGNGLTDQDKFTNNKELSAILI
jgi:hypothetical protein